MADLEFGLTAEASTSASSKLRAAPRPVVLAADTPFDLDAYAAHLTGRRKIIRMLFIARSCAALAPDAYVLAVHEIQQKTFDVALYETVVAEYASRTDVDSRQLTYSEAWVERTRRHVADQHDKLEVELKNYQTNLIKESIRMAHRDIGAFQHRCGDHQAALRTYLKSRDFCTSTNQILDVCLQIIDVALDAQSYAFIKNYVVKAEAAYDSMFSSSTTAAQRSSTGPRPVTLPGMVGGTGSAAAQRQTEAEDRRRSLIADRIAVASGVAELGTGNYARAARKFLGVGPSVRDEDAGLYISPGDIAVYGTLCGLATLERPALKRHLIDNPNLRPLLELEPHLKDLVAHFHESNYKAALRLLERYEPRHILDVHLSHHVDALLTQIRARAVVQYFAPFSAASLARMAGAFGWTEENMQAEVVRLIGKKEFKARVDSRNKVVHAYAPSQRAALFKRALETGQQQETAARALLLRMNLIANDIVVKAPKASGKEVAHQPDEAVTNSMSPTKSSVQQFQQHNGHVE